MSGSGERSFAVTLRSELAPGFAPDTVISDVDGVLVDVSESTRACLVRSVERAQRLAGASRVWIPTPADVQTLKLAGGFNDDLIAAVGLTAIAAAGLTHELGAISSTAARHGGGLAGLACAGVKTSGVDGDLMERIYDEYYWGASAFREIY